MAEDAAHQEPENLSRQKRWQNQNPLARWSHMAVQSAINRGILVRQPCEVCGDEKTDAHHDDYRKPIDVRWLCRRHHIELHAKQRQEE